MNILRQDNKKDFFNEFSNRRMNILKGLARLLPLDVNGQNVYGSMIVEYDTPDQSKPLIKGVELIGFTDYRTKDIAESLNDPINSSTFIARMAIATLNNSHLEEEQQLTARSLFKSSPISNGLINELYRVELPNYHEITRASITETRILGRPKMVNNETYETELLNARLNSFETFIQQN